MAGRQSKGPLKVAKSLRKCTNCGERKTSKWRYHQEHKGLVCNRCWVHYQTYNCDRPPDWKPQAAGAGPSGSHQRERDASAAKAPTAPQAAEDAQAPQAAGGPASTGCKRAAVGEDGLHAKRSRKAGSSLDRRAAAGGTAGVDTSAAGAELQLGPADGPPPLLPSHWLLLPPAMEPAVQTHQASDYGSGPSSPGPSLEQAAALLRGLKGESVQQQVVGAHAPLFSSPRQGGAAAKHPSPTEGKAEAKAKAEADAEAGPPDTEAGAEAEAEVEAGADRVARVMGNAASRAGDGTPRAALHRLATACASSTGLDPAARKRVQVSLQRQLQVADQVTGLLAAGEVNWACLVPDLQQQLEQKQGQLERALGARADAEGEAGRLRNELGVLAGKVAAAYGQVMGTQMQLVQVKQELDEERTAAAATEALLQKREEVIRRLEEQQVEVEAAAEREAKELLKGLVRLSKQVEQQRQARAAAEQAGRMQQMGKAAAEVQVWKLRQELEQERAARAAAEREATQAREEGGQLQLQLGRQRAAAEARARELSEGVASLRKELEQAYGVARAAEQEAAGQRQAREELERRLGLEEGSRRAMGQQMQQLLAQCSSLLAEKGALNDQLYALQQRLRSAEEEVVAAKQKALEAQLR